MTNEKTDTESRIEIMRSQYDMTVQLLTIAIDGNDVKQQRILALGLGVLRQHILDAMMRDGAE